MGRASEALLDGLIQQLDAIIDQTVHARLEDAAYLCRMARLELLMRRHDIRDHEVKAIGRALRRQGAPDGVVLRRRSTRRAAGRRRN
jgi:hypothetical protein